MKESDKKLSTQKLWTRY